MVSMPTIIVAARNQLPDTDYNSQMLPIRGKPALTWVIEDYVLDNRVIVVLNKKNILLRNYLRKRYPTVELIELDFDEQLQQYKSYSVLTSLNAGLMVVKEKIGVRVVLGDTLCRYISDLSNDVILVSNDFVSSERWCLIEEDTSNQLKTFYDKQPNLDITGKKAVVGYYQFSDISLLKKIVIDVISSGKSQMSNVLELYNKIINIECVEAKVWFDLGHKAGVIKAQNYFYDSREFNCLTANPIEGTIIKTSSKRQKLADEYAWYNSMPKNLQTLVPRCFDYSEQVNKASFKMELYGYPALSELFILGDLSIEEWTLILKRLFEVHSLFEKYTSTIDKTNFYDLYMNKTWQRLNELKNQDMYWEKLWNYKYIVINNQKYKNIMNYEEQLKMEIEKLVDSSKVTIMHGDYCFSNILFDTNSFVCKLIDPRGRLQEQSIYGDPRYDIAKIRHSAVGGYDFAVHGLFTLKENKNYFYISDNYPLFQDKLTKIFDNLTIEFGYNVKEIQLIEALLFATMIPLHKDCIERQKLFYLKAVKKINEYFEVEND